MAVQKNVIKGILAGTFALMLSGCVTVPDAIKGSSRTPQQDLVRVMSAPQLYVGQEARFGGKVVAVQNQQGKPARKLLPYRWTAVPDRRWENLLAVAFMLM